jgi:hypothetical protein
MMIRIISLKNNQYRLTLIDKNGKPQMNSQPIATPFLLYKSILLILDSINSTKVEIKDKGAFSILTTFDEFKKILC